jgi:type IX secretion system PorP/SprF family membrane protein
MGFLRSCYNFYLIRAIALSSVCVISISVGNAQDIQFSQFYNVPLYLSPAFAGSAHAFRGTANQRIQWPRANVGKYITSLVSMDGYFSKYKSGVGLMFIQDYQGAGAISSTEVDLQYAYEINLSSKFTFRPGLQVSYVSRSFDYVNALYTHQFNDNGFLGGTGPVVNPAKFVDISSGGVLYSDKAWFGFTANHINTPNESFKGGASSSHLPVKFSFTAGYKILFLNRNYTENINGNNKVVSLTPTAHYKFQGKSDQLDLGLYGMYDQALVGLWYRGIPFKKYAPNLPNNESIVVLLGWRYKTFCLSYSYDFVISKLSQARTGGSHEINITFIKSNRKKVKPMKRLPCPSFYKH